MVLKNCKKCGKEFNALRKDKEFCCAKCRDTNYSRVCIICHKEFKGYKTQKYCSSGCKEIDASNRLDRAKQTNLKKYGTEFPSQNKDVRKKIKKTFLERFGTDHPMRCEKIKEKAKKTSLEKYGTEFPSQSEEFRKKVNKTNLKKFGCITPFQNEEIKEKIKKTNLEKYGVKHSFQNKEIQEKFKKTSLDRYGTEHPFQNKEVREKYKDTMLKKYDVEYPAQDKEIYKKMAQTFFNNYGVTSTSQFHINNFQNLTKDFLLNNFVKNGFFLLEECCEYFNISSLSTIIKFKKDNNIDIPNKQNKTKTQQEIFNFIKGFYNDDVKFNDRKIISPYELDVYIPEKNLAIEFDGLLYHSYGKSEYLTFNNYLEEDKNYHLRKTELCESKNIKLFHVFENEWINPVKKEIWKSKIKIELGFVDRKLNARDCIIKTINAQEIKSFLKLNHLQGYVSSSINLGLYYKDELVEIITFGKSRFNKNFDWELLRNCTKINTIVRGGFNKLLSYFKKNYKGSIISYGNRRWTSRLKNVYGNNLINISEPNYFYFTVKDFVLFSRQTFQKHKLKDKLEMFDENLTETENMYNNGYRKIYDCGNLVYKI